MLAGNARSAQKLVTILYVEDYAFVKNARSFVFILLLSIGIVPNEIAPLFGCHKHHSCD